MAVNDCACVKKGDGRMRIEGIGAGAVPAVGNRAQLVDATSKSLQKQIENAQKQMQALAKNDQLSPEDKMKKRQELQKQITDLNQQLRQHEIELRKKQTEEAREQRERERGEHETDREKEQEQMCAISKEGMSALLSADFAMKQAEKGDGVVTRMKGETRVLAGEIKQDKSRGVGTAKKEEKLSDLEKRIDDAVGGQIKTLAEANKKLADTSEEEYEKRLRDEKKAGEDDRQAGNENVGKAVGSEGAAKTDAAEGAWKAKNQDEEALAQRMKREQGPGQTIDEQL